MIALFLLLVIVAIALGIVGVRARTSPAATAPSGAPTTRATPSSAT